MYMTFIHRSEPFKHLTCNYVADQPCNHAALHRCLSGKLQIGLLMGVRVLHLLELAVIAFIRVLSCNVCVAC